MKRLPMRKIRDVLRLSAEGLSTRQMASSFAIGRTTLQGYLDRAHECLTSAPMGQFRVITEVVLNLEPVVTEQATALVVPSNDKAMLTLLRHLETRAGPLLSAFEFISRAAMKHTFNHAASLKNPFARGEIPDTALLIELSRPTKAPWDTPLDTVLEAVLSEAWGTAEAPIKDALFGRLEEIWALRHALSEGVKSAGPLIAFDLGFTRDKVIAFRAEKTRKLAQNFPMMEICDFGHLGDGGLHFNLVKTDGPVDATFEQALRDYVVDQTVKVFCGSFGAEHGIGPKNIRYFEKSEAHQQAGQSSCRMLAEHTSSAVREPCHR